MLSSIAIWLFGAIWVTAVVAAAILLVVVLAVYLVEDR